MSRDMDDLPSLREEQAADLLRPGLVTNQGGHFIGPAFEKLGDSRGFALRALQLGDTVCLDGSRIADDEGLWVATRYDDILSELGLQQLPDHAGPHCWRIPFRL